MLRLLSLTPASFVFVVAAIGCSQAEHPREASRRASNEPLHAHPGGCRQCHETLEKGLPLYPSKARSCETSGCHATIDRRPRFVHGPVALGECRTCHHQHSSTEPKLLTLPGRDLCGSCHQELFSCPSAGAALEAECVSCHTAHGSQRSHLLRENL